MRQPVFLGLRDDRDARHVVRERPGTVEGGGVDTVAAGRPWEALRDHATRTRAASGDEVVDLLGVRLTHPDRVYYPDLGFTKLDLALYYVSIADAVLPHLEGRPLTLVRCPDGIGGETFFQKKAGLLDAAPGAALRGPGRGRGAPLRRLGARPRGARPGRDPRDPPVELARVATSSSRTR